MFMIIGLLILLAVAFCGSFIYYFFKYLYLIIVKKEVINIGNVDVNNIDDEIDQTIDDEIAMLEIAIQRRQLVAIELENELNNSYGKAKQQILLKLNTLDKQTFKDKQRILKLKNEL